MIKRNFYPLTLIVIILFGVWQVAAAENKAAPPPPKIYAAAVVIPQAAHPLVNELKNSTGSVVTISRVGGGQYLIESDPPAFIVGRTMYYTHYYNMGPSATVQASMTCLNTGSCRLQIFSSDPSGNSLYFYDGGTSGTAIPIYIEVYP